jgi:hypothetical protein
MAAKKEAFGGKQAKPFGKKGDDDKAKKAPAKKQAAKKK